MLLPPFVNGQEEIKLSIGLLGDSSTGKTTLTYRLCGLSINNVKPTTAID